MRKWTRLWLGILLTLLPAIPVLAQTKPLVNFPADERPHSAPVEWYYYTGRLQVLGEESKTYGVEAVIFQFNIPGMPVYYAAHTALTDVNNQHFQYAQDYSFVDQRPTQPAMGFKLSAGNNQFEGVGGLQHIATTNSDYAFDLRAISLKPATLMNGNGYEQLGNGGMFYYSYVDMATIGTLTLNGQKKVVTGTLWTDHQWGYMASDVKGWDWFSLRLDDNTQLMGFVLKLADGGVISQGTFVQRDGRYIKLPDGDLIVTPTGDWTSPTTGITYPSGWRLTSTTLDLSATIMPELANQEILYNMAPGAPPTTYWEGLSSLNVMKRGKHIGGYAYVELTGYTK